jgi:hypothetical protein
MQHRREGKFVRVLGNVATVRIFHGPVKWLFGLREIGALLWMILPEDQGLEGDKRARRIQL